MTSVQPVYAKRKVVHEGIHVILGPSQVKTVDDGVKCCDSDSEVSLGHFVNYFVDKTVNRGVEVASGHVLTKRGKHFSSKGLL